MLPKALVDEIRKYTGSALIYVSKTSSSDEKRGEWGAKTGTRRTLDDRNREIREKHRRGESVADLSQSYCLCEDSIRKIIKSAREEQPQGEI